MHVYAASVAAQWQRIHRNAGDSGDTSSIPGLGGSKMATCFSISPGKLNGQRSLVDYSPQWVKESQTQLVTACTQGVCIYNSKLVAS